MKIVILDRSTVGFDINVDIFNTLGDVTTYAMTEDSETKSRIKDADIVITNKVVISKDHMRDSNIKLICISATGMNNVDLEYAKEKGIEVKNVAGYSSSSVSQVAFGMIFHFVQKLNYYKLYVDEGKWQESKIFTHIDKPFFELDNKRVGVIGLGDIGSSFAKRAKAFDCEVVYYSTSGRNNNSEFKRVELDELLKTSDIISIHCPLNKQTEDLLNYENMKTMKDISSSITAIVRIFADKGQGFLSATMDANEILKAEVEALKCADESEDEEGNKIIGFDAKHPTQIFT